MGSPPRQSADTRPQRGFHAPFLQLQSNGNSTLDQSPHLNNVMMSCLVCRRAPPSDMEVAVTALPGSTDITILWSLDS
jgi:hypothetical protein